MKTILIDLSDLTDIPKRMMILKLFLNTIDYVASNAEIRQMWKDICEGGSYTFNPYHVYMHDSVLYISNKNHCITATANVLSRFEIDIKDTLDLLKP